MLNVLCACRTSGNREHQEEQFAVFAGGFPALEVDDAELIDQAGLTLQSMW